MATTSKQQLSTNNYLLVMLLITLLVVGVGVFATKALIGSISRDTKVLSAKNIANRQLDSDLRSAPQLVDAFKGLDVGTAIILNHALPTTPDFPGLISLLETAGAQAGMTVNSVSPNLVASQTAAPTANTSVNEPTAQTTNVSIQVTGSYAALGKMLKNLELSARPIRVTGLQITGTGTNLTGTLSITTYYQAQAKLPFSTRTIQ